MIDDELVCAHRARALSPDHPVLRGSSQNPDVYLPGARAVNPFYDALPEIVQDAMDQFAALTGRQYHLFEYVGAPDAERVIVLMGSGAEAVDETVDHLNAPRRKSGRGEGAAVPSVCRRSACSRPFPPRATASPCWTAPRNRARTANRSTRMW